MPRKPRKAGRATKDAERRRIARAHGRGATRPAPAARGGVPVVWVDGGSRGNPGPAACAFRVVGAGCVVLAEGSERIGTATVGTAEYRGVVAGLHAALGLGLARIEVRCDSRLVVAQMTGEREARSPALAALRDEARDLAERIGTVEYRWIEGAQNPVDALVAAELAS